MTRERSIDERIGAWLLDEAPDQLPDRVLRTTSERTRSTRQRRAFLRWRGYPVERLNPAMIAVGAAAILILAIGAAVVLRPGPSVGGPPTAAPTAAPSATPTTEPSGADGVSWVTDLPGRFAYSSYRTGNADIYAMNPDGSELEQLTRDPADDKLPSWSPDGSKIAFTSDRTGDEQIWLMNADGSNQVQLTTNDVSGSMARWSPDGSQLVVAARMPSPDSLYVVSADGNESHVLLDPREHDLQLAVDPFWAPGDRVGFTGLAGQFSDLYTVAADGTDLRQLTTTATEDGSGSWSPDGRWVAFQSDDDGGCIYRINADGSGQVKLTDKCSQGFSTTWSPDGNWIAWAGGPHGPDTISVMDQDGVDRRAITNVPDIRDLNWGVAP